MSCNFNEDGVRAFGEIVYFCGRKVFIHPLLLTNLNLQLTTMKKIYLFLSMLFGLFGLTNMSAQTAKDWEPDYDNPLIEDVEQFSSPWSDSAEGNFYSLLDRLGECPDDQHPNNDFWHSSWHESSYVLGSHYFQVEMLDPESLPDEICFVFTRRPADNDHTTKWSVRGTNDPEAEKDACEELAIIETPFTNNTETLTSDKFNPKGYQFLRFYSEEQYPSSRTYFHLSRFQLYPIVPLSEFDVYERELREVLDKYYNYYDMFDVGTAPGQYGEAEVDAFYAALDAGDELGNYTPGNEPSVEEMKVAIQAILDTYQAVLDSRVAFNLADGYYRVRGALKYINSIETGEVDEDGNPFTEDVEVDKYMLSVESVNSSAETVIAGRWGTPEQLETDATAIWKITAQDGYYDMVSLATGARFCPVSRSVDVVMHPDSLNLMAFDVVYTDEDDQTSVNIRLAKQQPTDAEKAGNSFYQYLHQAGHSNGTGVSGTLVGWNCTFSNEVYGASEWVFDPVSEEEAQAALEAYTGEHQGEIERAKMVAEYNEMVSKAKEELVIAKDIKTIIDEEQPLVSDDNPITSPCSDSAEGQHIEYLWDGSGDTFWHSSWHSEYEIEDHHYFQVEVTDPQVYASAVFTFTRRNTTSGNQINKWSVWGTNSDFEDTIDSDEPMIQGSEGLEKLADITTPYHGGNNTESYVSDVFETKGYQYLRFYVEGTCNNDGTQGGNSKFMHLAEFQVYPGQIDDPATSQYKVMGDLATNLEKVLEDQAAVTDEDLTIEQFNTLKAAYDAFNAKFVDPTELRNAIASVKEEGSIVVVGTNPGFWADNSTAETLNATIAAAQAYDVAGNYSPEKSAEFIETMNAQAEAIEGAALPVKVGKWYRFRFGTEEEYEKYGWPAGGNEVDVDETDIVRNEALFGKYVTVADFVSENGYNTVIPIAANEVAMENYLFVDDDADIAEKDLSLFRFISVGDSAYVIQNKATGLFFNNNSYMRLSVHPTLFTQHIAGYGQNAFFTKKLNGEETSPMHTARAYNILTSWGYQSEGTWAGYGNTDGRRGCFFVEEVEDVTADYAGVDFKINLKPGSFHAYCFPMDLEADGMYGVNAVEVGEEGTLSVTLVPIAKAAAGRPFVHITEGTYDSEAEAIPVEFKHGYDIVANPIESSLLKGVFYETEIGAGCIVPTDGGMMMTTSSTHAAGNNRAYIAGEEPYDTSAEVTYTIDENGEDGIAGALAKVAKVGTLYTLDGQLISSKANLNSLRNMPKGIYILNGVKVTVK